MTAVVALGPPTTVAEGAVRLAEVVARAGVEVSAAKSVADLLPPCGSCKGADIDGETPETGTPATRSQSPSSDGGHASPPSDFDLADCHVRGPFVADEDSANGSVPLVALSTHVEVHGAVDGRAVGGGVAFADCPSASGGGRRGTREARPKAPSRVSSSKSVSRWPHTVQPGHLPPPTAPSGGAGPTVMTSNSFSDRRIIEVLAATQKTHRRLVRTARRVPEIVLDCGDHALASSAELYGSLALDMGMMHMTNWKQDWASYYVNGRSDVDFVVEMQPRVKPASVAERLLKKGPWRMVGQVQVHKFASTQFTLLGRFDEDSDDETIREKDAQAREGKEKDLKDGEEARRDLADDAVGKEGSSTSEVYLDITCIENPLHFKRFRKRQEAFREVFSEVRASVEGQFGAQGALAFDAYIHLLKAFAAKVPENALTGYQATCIGLFTLQIGHFRLKPTHSIALSFFEGFLRFCLAFYGDSRANWSWNCRQFAIDLSMGGRWLPRMSTSWRSELYFMQAEEQMRTHPDERVNITHSLDPGRVCVEAYALLQRAFTGDQHQHALFLGQAASAAAGPPTACARA